MAFLVIGLVLVVGGIVAYFQASGTLGECQTTLGQLGRMLSSNLQQQCQQAGILRTGGAVAAAVGLLTVIVGVFRRN